MAKTGLYLLKTDMDGVAYIMKNGSFMIKVNGLIRESITTIMEN